MMYIIRKHSCIITGVSIYMNQHHMYAIPDVPIDENPSCLHTTLASDVLQESSHTVLHVLLLQISTRPSYLCIPPWSLMSPLVHGATVKDNIRLWIEIQKFMFSHATCILTAWQQICINALTHSHFREFTSQKLIALWTHYRHLQKNSALFLML